MKTYLTLAFFVAALSTPAAIQVTSGVFTVDRTAPGAPVAVSPAAGGTVNTLPVFLEAVAEDAVSGVVAYRFDIGGTVSAWVPSTYNAGLLADGAHIWRAQAKDAAGHISVWSVDFNFDVLNIPDEDNDGLADAWEMAHFGRLNYTDGLRDSDGDGVPDAEEYAAGENPYEFYLGAIPGWNLLALPFDATEIGLASLDGVRQGPLWQWDGRRFVPVQLPVAGQGFWLYSARRIANLAVSGLPPAVPSRDLDSGWNLAGPGTASPIAIAPTGATVWDVDGRRQKRLPTDGFFAPLRGYWIFTKAPGTLPVGGN